MLIVKRIDKVKKLQYCPKVGLWQRTFGWLNWKRRLSKDYVHSITSSESLIKIAMVQIMLVRISKFKT